MANVLACVPVCVHDRSREAEEKVSSLSQCLFGDFAQVGSKIYFVFLANSLLIQRARLMLSQRG